MPDIVAAGDPLALQELPSWAATWQPAVLWLARAANRNTRRSYTAPVRGLMISARVPLPEVVEPHVLAYNVALGDRGLAPRTIRHHIIVLGAFFAWAMARGHHPGPNPAAGVPLPGQPRGVAGIALDAAEVERLVAAATSPRDRALLRLLADGGLRAAEAVALQERDVHLVGDVARIHVRRGKGGRPRDVEAGAGAAEDLGAYLEGGERRLTGPTSPFLQRAADWRGAAGGIGYTTVYGVVRDCAARAGLGHVAPHDLRRTYATLELDLGQPLPAVQGRMGHQHMEQTARYYRPRR